MTAKRRQVERFWAKYAGSIAFVTLLVVSGLGFARIENARYAGCVAGNLLRAGIRQAEQTSIRQTEQVNPDLFPSIPPAEFRALTRQSVRRAEYRIKHLYADRPCGTRINLPLTGAAIVFPP